MLWYLTIGNSLVDDRRKALTVSAPLILKVGEIRLNKVAPFPVANVYFLEIFNHLPNMEARKQL